MRNYLLADKVIGEKDIANLIEWLKKNPRLTKDKLTWEFEKQWAKWVGTKYAVFCNSGSSANLLATYAALISEKLDNKKVIVPSVGWVTTVAPFIQFGFEPIMCGSNKDDFGLDSTQLETLLEKHHPAVVSMVQVLGVPTDMDKLKKLQAKYNFLLFEDACAALGSQYNDRMVGSFGDLATFSFYFGHQLSTIEGGMVNTNDEQMYYLLLMLRSHGWGKDLPDEYKSSLMLAHRVDPYHSPFTFFVPGFNVRSTDLNAFLGIEQMKKADKITAVRKRNHMVYFHNLKTVEFQKWGEKAVPCSISFGALAKNVRHRKKITEALDRNNIETRLFSAGNLGLHPFWFERYGKFHDEVADKVHFCGFFLPNNESLTEKDILYICDVVNRVSNEE